MQSDLAVEFSKNLVKNKDYTKKVVKVNENIKSTLTEILTNDASKRLGFNKGTYALLEIPFEPTLQILEKKNIEKELKKMLKFILKKSGVARPKSALVVGLGNPKMLADCFGSKVVEKVVATRPALLSGIFDGKTDFYTEKSAKNCTFNFEKNITENAENNKKNDNEKSYKNNLKLSEKNSENNLKDFSKKQDYICSVSKLSCNVFGLTGLESFDVIKSAVEVLKPEVVILIDTLVAGSAKRLCTNFQIANVGIVPGSGVDNARKELSAKTLKTTVITIGVPFVVYASDIFMQEIEKLPSVYQKNLKNSIKNIKDLIVMPREIEDELKFCSGMLAGAINSALNPKFSKTDFERYFG